ncbi:MAG: chemotaxis protein CheX [Polyangiales bacterium]
MEQNDSTQMNAQLVVEDMAEEACFSLFDAYGVPLTKEQPETLSLGERALTSIVGFTGEGLTGMVLVSAAEGLLVKSNPVGGASLRDWVAEMSNQLAGRLKHKLLAQGVEVYITTPIVLRAARVEPLPRTTLSPRTFSNPEGFLGLWVEVDSAPGFKFQPGAAGEAVAEGETLLF